MIAELRLHRPLDLALLHAEGRIGEGRHVRLAIRPAEIAALLGGARILRELLRELGEILTALGALQDLFGLRLDRGIVLRIRDLQKDVAHAALLGLHVTLRRLRLLIVVVGLELRVVDAHLEASAARLSST